MHVAAARLAGAMLLFGAAGSVFSVELLPPDQLVRDTANATLAEIRQRSDELSKNPEQLYALVEDRLVPHFDINLIARQVLGRYWTQATPEQRARFASAFRRSLIRTYAKALLAFKDNDLTWAPAVLSADGTEASVKSTVASSNGTALSVNYKMHRVDDKWLVNDITIDGVSLVTNYRGIFVNEVRKSNMEDVIDRLEKKVAS